jgi:hypothetical protein
VSRTFILIVGVLAVVVAILLFPAIRTNDPDPAALYHRMVALKDAMVNYRMEYGIFPTGTYAQVISILSGDNPVRSNFCGWPSTALTAQVCIRTHGERLSVSS